MTENETPSVDVSQIESYVQNAMEAYEKAQAEKNRIEAEKKAEIKSVLDAEREEIRKETEDAVRHKLELEQQEKRIQQETFNTVYKSIHDKLEQEYAAKRRLPDYDGVPHIARFSDTWKYDNLKPADLAFMVAAQMQTKQGATNAACKALMAKFAEDKSDLGGYAQWQMKAIGLNPADALNAVKANELNYPTQVGFGNEFVPDVMSTALWENIRVNTFVVDLLPNREFSGPGDTFPIPVQGADSTWYKVPQATGTNATTGLPDATITASKIATDNQSITLAKIGTRVIWATEMDEDSIIAWTENARRQCAVSGAETVEHLVIDGDTDASATTNINDIGGTPAATDVFLTLNGLRKLPLITTTANSRSASGAYVDTDYIETLKLMGAAGVNALDRDKTCFIQDANVGWKSLTLVAVKTQDVFSQPTIENGVLTGIYGRKVYTSPQMHKLSADRKANVAGKIDQDTTANNTRGAILAVRMDQWLLGWKRRITMVLQDIPGSDAKQLVVTMRLGLVERDGEASAITYNVGI